MVCGSKKQKQSENSKAAPIAKPPSSQLETPSGTVTGFKR